jgi:hypothetical protein
MDMSTPDPDQLIGSFLRSLLPTQNDQAYTLLARLDYPIPDLRTFRERLKRFEGNAETVETLASLFEPEDFGMDTAQSAFEKFSKRGSHLNLPGVPLPRESLKLLADIVTAGGLNIEGTNVVFRMNNGSVEVECGCSPKPGGTGGSCEMVIQGNVLVCTDKSCDGDCTLTARIPSFNLLARALKA